MVRTAVAGDSYLNYLANLSKSTFPTVGLILGQPTLTKDYIVHFARTPRYDGDGQKTPPKTFADISEIWIADHARHVTRMLPGGMYVLGIFIISSEDSSTFYVSKSKAIINQMHKTLGNNEFLYGNPLKHAEKLILSYSSSSKSCTCKHYNLETGLISSTEIKFEHRLSVKWLQLECRYELDQIFPIFATKADSSLKKHMQDILKSIHDSLKSAEFFFDGEIKDETDSLESVGKKKKVPRTKLGHHDHNDTKFLQVTIILPGGSVSSESNVHVIDCVGQMRLAGHVATKLWLHPKVTVKEASVAIIQDIERSLAARLEMHWDSLIDEEQDINSIHETPRRVLVNLPSGKVTLSDYLFPGEGLQEAQISLKELLDIDVSDETSISDTEGQADLTDLCSEETEADDLLQKLPKTTNKYVYFSGLAIAILVLIISLLIHLIQN